MKVGIKKLLDDEIYCEEIFMFYKKRKVVKENKSKLFEKHINKALSNLEFANFLLEEHKFSIKEKLPNRTFYDWCIIIYYYAIYHAALALLAKAGYDSKNHIATITAIALLYYHKTNILKKEDVKFIIEKISLERRDIDFIFDSKELRERACYGADQLFELKQAVNLQKETADFVNKIRGLLEK